MHVFLVYAVIPLPAISVVFELRYGSEIIAKLHTEISLKIASSFRYK